MSHINLSNTLKPWSDEGEVVAGFDIADFPSSGDPTVSYTLIPGSNFLWPKDDIGTPLSVGPYNLHPGDGIYMQYDVSAGAVFSSNVAQKIPSLIFAPAVKNVFTDTWYALGDVGQANPPFIDAISTVVPAGTTDTLMRVTEGALFLLPPGRYECALYCATIINDDLADFELNFGPFGLARPRIWANKMNKGAIGKAVTIPSSQLITITPGAVPYKP